ncbi:hypothetical protein ACMAZF_20490 (plasmid) [Psychrobium sp. nBUS_13]|uniref:hypothetical protein n=1 Tax=Psychrobium sp. nBUS_13 TaxID=3395319 RepID=UPI003EBEB523
MPRRLPTINSWSSLQTQYATLIASALTKSRYNATVGFSSDETAAFNALGMEPHKALEMYKGSSIQSIADILAYRAVRGVFVSLKENINDKMIPSIKTGKNKLTDAQKVSVVDTLDSLNNLDELITEALNDYDKEIISRLYSLEVMVNLSKLSDSMS